jgi:two-component system sensor histidine kinase KdpD
MSRIEAGALRPDKEWYPLSALVEDVLGRLRPAAADHPIAVDVPDSLPPVPLDYVEIDQVLTNVIENAARHTPPGSTIWIAAERESDAVAITVADDGPGIAPHARARLFDPFVRGGDRRTAARGAGLGLAIARGIVNQHGGQIWAESTLGVGTTVCVALPRLARDAQVTWPPALADEEAAA